MLSSHSVETTTFYYDLVYQVCHDADSCNFTISESNPHGPAAFPFFILPIKSVTIISFVKHCTPLTVSTTGKISSSHTDSIFKSSSRFLQAIYLFHHFIPTHYYHYFSAGNKGQSPFNDRTKMLHDRLKFYIANHSNSGLYDTA